MSNQITLTTNTPSIIYLCSKDKRLAKLISMIGEISYTPHEDGFAFLIHEIIEQMLSVKAAAKIYSRLVSLCDGQITPSALNSLSDEQIKIIGTSNASRYLYRALDSGLTKSEFHLFK